MTYSLTEQQNSKPINATKIPDSTNLSGCIVAKILNSCIRFLVTTKHKHLHSTIETLDCTVGTHYLSSPGSFGLWCSQHPENLLK